MRPTPDVVTQLLVMLGPAKVGDKIKQEQKLFYQSSLGPKKMCGHETRNPNTSVALVPNSFLLLLVRHLLLLAWHLLLRAL